MEKTTKGLIIALAVVLGIFIFAEIKLHGQRIPSWAWDSSPTPWKNETIWVSIGNLSDYAIFNSTGDTPPVNDTNITNSTDYTRTAGGGGGGGGGGETPPPAPPAPPPEEPPADYNNWSVIITAVNQLEEMEFGTHSNASDGYDALYDTYTQFPQIGYVIMSLDAVYATSIKQFENNSESWALIVDVPAGESTNLTMNITDLRSEVNVSFIIGNESYDIRVNTTLGLGEGQTNINVSAVG